MWLTRLVTVCATLSCVAIVQTLPAWGRTQDDRLSTVRTLACTFTVMARGTWTQNGPEAAIDESTLSFRVESIDTEDASAEVLGPFGSSPVVAQARGDNLHFVQVLGTGPLYTTTVFNRETTAGKFMAVHTRHEYLDVTLIGVTSRPEQYYGECEER